MFRIKKIEALWNAHTPAYLHPYTKENLVWQLKLIGAATVGVVAYDAWKERQERKTRMKRHDVPEND